MAACTNLAAIHADRFTSTTTLPSSGALEVPGPCTMSRGRRPRRTTPAGATAWSRQVAIARGLGARAFAPHLPQVPVQPFVEVHEPQHIPTGPKPDLL